MVLLVIACLAAVVSAFWTSRKSPLLGDIKRALLRFEQRFTMADRQTQQPGQWTPDFWRIGWVLLVAALGVAAFAWIVFYSLAEFSGHDPQLIKPWKGGVSAANRGDLVRDTLGTVALFGATAAAVYAYRKQRLDEASSRRADAEGLAARYQDAANLLGSEQAAVRLAGAYAMGRLADEWPDQRQTCVDVLCAYLRMQPKLATYETDDGSPYKAHEVGDMEVRRTITDLITSRLGPQQSGGIWSDCEINLSGAYLIDFGLRDVRITKELTVRGAMLAGDCAFVDAHFEGGVNARNLEVLKTTRIRDVRVGRRTSFALQGLAIRAGARVLIGIKPPGEASQNWLWLARVNCQGTLHIQSRRVEYAPKALRIWRTPSGFPRSLQGTGQRCLAGQPTDRDRGGQVEDRQRCAREAFARYGNRLCCERVDGRYCPGIRRCIQAGTAEDATVGDNGPVWQYRGSRGDCALPGAARVGNSGNLRARWAW